MNWTRFLHMSEFAYNSQYQASIKCSPFMASQGYEPSHPGRFKTRLIPRNNDDAQDAAARFKAILRQVQDHMANAQRVQKEQHNKHRRLMELKVGDYVLVDRRVRGIPGT